MSTQPLTMLELRDQIAKAIAKSIGHGMREKCEKHANAVLSVVMPQLTATADAIDAHLSAQAKVRVTAEDAQAVHAAIMTSAGSYEDGSIHLGVDDVMHGLESFAARLSQGAQSSGNPGELTAERAAVPDVVLELLRDLSVYRSPTYTEVINAFGNRAKALLEALTAAPQPSEGARVVDAKTPFDANPLARPIEDFLSGFRKRYSSSRGRGIKANAPMQDIVAPLAEAWNQYLLSWPQKLTAPTLAGKEG